jgi:hypothetical protein
LLLITVGCTMFFLGRRSVSFTHVPEINLHTQMEPAFESIVFCIDCKIEPWQKVTVGKTLSAGLWSFDGLTIKVNDNGFGGSISCTKSQVSDKEKWFIGTAIPLEPAHAHR